MGDKVIENLEALKIKKILMDDTEYREFLIEGMERLAVHNKKVKTISECCAYMTLYLSLAEKLHYIDCK